MINSRTSRVSSLRGAARAGVDTRQIVDHKSKIIHTLGFTLIELLVVIAVIALLMAILMPVLQNVRKQGKATVCQANLHQWGMLFATLGEGNEGRLRDRDAWDHCRTQQFAYYLDNFTFEDFCPMATRKVSTTGVGSKDLAWYCPRHPYRAGSYGLNGWTPAYDGGEGTGPQPSAKQKRWKSIYSQSTNNVPVMLDCALWAGYPTHYDTPPQTENEAATNPNVSLTNSMRPFCIPRHGEFIHGVFMDWSVRKLGLKELWTLAWSPDFNVNGPFTRAAGMRPEDWPTWMRRFKDY
jgi:prepilin-type N-terminal cleavage/methylation domain-containing protein